MTSTHRPIGTPRTEPWKQPSPPPWVEARDRAFEHWARNGLCVATTPELVFAKAAFCAGWDAAQRLETFVDTRARDFMKAPENKLAEHLDETKLGVLSLFPTDAELDPK